MTPIQGTLPFRFATLENARKFEGIMQNGVINDYGLCVPPYIREGDAFVLNPEYAAARYEIRYFTS